MLKYLRKKPTSKFFYMIKYAAITPHPPVMVPEIGGKEGLKPIENTIKGMLKVTADVSLSEPNIIMVISPHGQIFIDSITVKTPAKKSLTGSLWQFGDSNLQFDYTIPIEFIKKILVESANSGLKVEALEDSSLDHGFSAPMYYIEKGLKKKPEIVSMNISLASYEKHFEFGKILSRVSSASNENIVLIASGDLSHRLTKDSPGGYHKEGKKFDEKLVKYLKEGKHRDILLFDPFWVDEAGECGLRSICTLLGFIEGHEYKPMFYSYECPYGVGYLVMGYKF